jgi:hypothetical protein
LFFLLTTANIELDTLLDLAVSKNACSQSDPKNNGENNNSNVTISCFSYTRYIWTLPYCVTVDVFAFIFLVLGGVVVVGIVVVVVGVAVGGYFTAG